VQWPACSRPQASGVELSHIFNRNIARKRSSDAAKHVPGSVVWTENFDDVLNSRADIVVELMADSIRRNAGCGSPSPQANPW